MRDILLIVKWRIIEEISSTHYVEDSFYSDESINANKNRKNHPNRLARLVMLEKIRVSDYIINFIEDIGVDTIFMVPGGGAMYLNDALYCSKNVNHIANHHEQASVLLLRHIPE